MSFIISVILSIFSTCDELLSSMAGALWAIIYIKYLQPHNGIRGDDDFSVLGLLPNHCCTLCDEPEGDAENPQGGNVPPLGPNPMQGNNNRQNNNNEFRGRPHRIG